MPTGPSGVTGWELHDSRATTAGKSATLKYLIHGTSDETQAILELQAMAPLTFNTLIRQPVSVEPLYIDTGDSSKSFWRGTATYAPFERLTPPAVGESFYQFDTSGGSQHITQALEHISTYVPSGESVPDHDGAIGVHGDDVDGVDVVVPVFAFSERHYLDDDDVDDNFKAALANLTGKVNDDDFKGFAAGEVLFVGAQGSKRGEEDWEISFNFQASLNRTGLAVGPITGISKEGWQYLWVEYEDDFPSGISRHVKKPRAAHVERVYDEGDFSDLGIGT